MEQFLLKTNFQTCTSVYKGYHFHPRDFSRYFYGKFIITGNLKIKPRSFYRTISIKTTFQTCTSVYKGYHFLPKPILSKI